MKWMQLYLIGYAIVLIGILAALWKAGIIERVGTGWTIIGVVIAVGIGVMISISNSGRKIEIDHE